MNNGTGLFVTVCGTVPYGERSIEEFVANLAVRGCESPADIIWECILEEKGPEEIGRYTGMTLRVYRIILVDNAVPLLSLLREIQVDRSQILEVLSELQDED
jgi:hypothetical protein